MLHAALLKTQDAKNRHLGTIAQLCRAISLQLRHVLTIGKKILLSSSISSTCSHNMVNFGPVAADIGPVVLGHPYKFQRVSRLRSVTARHSSSGHQPNFVALNRGRHLYLAGRPSRWALAHISSFVSLTRLYYDRVTLMFLNRFIRAHSLTISKTLIFVCRLSNSTLRPSLAISTLTSLWSALCNRAGHIYFHPVVCSSVFFPRLISAVADWMSTILPHMVWP